MTVIFQNMRGDVMKRMIYFFLIMGLTVLLISCGEIVEEEDEETADITVTETVEVTSETVQETEETTPEEPKIPVYLNPDGKEFAALFGSFFHAESFSAAYGWDTGEDIVIFSVEYTAEEPYAGTAMLSINGGTPFDISCVALDEIRVTREFIAVEPGYTDIGGPLWVFDYDGNLIFAVHDVTVEGAQFRELRAVDDDGITVSASRIRHMELTGSAALQLQAPYAAYQNLLWDDPVSDFLPGMDAELPDGFSVDLSRGWYAVSDTLNPELVVSGEYRIPYLGEGQFGQIVPTENMKTLQTFMEAQFGERTPAVTQEPMTEPVTERVDITPPAGADLAAQVDHYLDLLMPDVESYSDMQSVRDKHPEVFDALVALGEDAVPLLQERGQGIRATYDSTPENFRRMLACTMAQAISPQLYQTDYPSPDGKYAVRAEVDSHFTRWDPFLGTVYTLSLVDLTSGETLASHGSGHSLENASVGFDRPPFLWSEDSRYAVYESGYRHYFTSVSLFDTVQGKIVLLPGEEELEALIGENLIYTEDDFTAEQVHCHFAAWYGDCIKIDVLLKSTFGGGAEIGYYIYDIYFDQIIEFRRYETTTADMGLIKQVETNLDLLLDGADGLYDESDIIARNPDAFDALVALGSDAIPYLTDIGDRMPAMRTGTEGNIVLSIRAALARMASYHIDQSLYDMTVLSPDGSICAVAKVGTFLSGDWGGTILTQYDRMVFTDTATGEILWEYPCEELYMIRLRNQQWSPDGRYFALTFGSESHGADSMVFDMTDMTARAFPDIREIVALAGLGEELPSHYHILVKAWREDGRLDGEVFFDYGMTTIGEGSFVFDPETGEISDFVCDVFRREDRGE